MPNKYIEGANIDSNCRLMLGSNEQNILVVLSIWNAACVLTEFIYHWEKGNKLRPVNPIRSNVLIPVVKILKLCKCK